MQNQIVLNLGPALMPDFMIGSLFHAILAWPTSDEAAAFHRVSEELAASVIRLTRTDAPDDVQLVKDRWPQFNWQSIEARARKSESALGYLDKRLKQRMAAARVGIGKIHRDIFDVPVVLPPTITALSLDQLCKLIATDVFIDDPENIEKLVWRKSLPILHLAMATQLVLAGQQKDGEGFDCDLQDIDFYRSVIEIAGLLEQVVHDHPDIAVTRDRLTLVRWFE